MIIMSGIAATDCKDQDCLDKRSARPSVVSPLDQTGFTLLELVVALTILGLMAAGVFSSFQLALNSYTHSQKRLDSKARERVMEDLVKRQVGSLFPLRPTASFLLSGTQDQPESPELQLSQIPLFYGTHEAVTFITVAPLELLENPGLTVVRYGLAQDEQGLHYLGAMETRYMGLDSFQSMANAPRGKPLPLIEKVQRVTFEYYGYDSDAQSYQWYDEWRGDEMHAVPSSIRINYDDRYLLVPVNASFFGSSIRGGLQGLIRP